MQKRSLLLISFLLLLWFQAKSATGYSDRCEKAYSYILCLRFNDAQILLDEEKTLNPSNTQPYPLENYIDFLKVMIGEEEQDYNRLKRQRNSRLEKLAYGDAGSPWYRYGQAVIYIQCGFARVKFHDYTTAGIELNQAYKLLEENNQRFPDFIPNKTCLGLLHALIGTVPNNYRWAVRTLKFKGTISQGINELNEAYTKSAKSRDYAFVFPESAFLLAFSAINLAGDKELVKKLIDDASKPLFQQWVNNSPLMTYALANIYLKTGNNDEAISLLKQRKQGNGYYPFYYLDYLLGIAKLNRLDKDANVPLLGFVANFKGMNYIKAAYEHIAWYYFINGNDTKYRLYLNRIKLRGEEQVDNDREAMRNAELQTEQNKYLLKARLLFDGGYYDRALAEINRFEKICDNAPLKEIVECTYRKARIYDEWGKDEQAINSYKSTINLGHKMPEYYAANACLHLGMIYERHNNAEQARHYYKECLSLDFEEYHFSITHKAKAGLNRLDSK
jgi:hypothetical protein